MTPQRINLITLVVSSLPSAMAFHTALGWRFGKQHDAVAFFDRGVRKLGELAHNPFWPLDAQGWFEPST